MVLTYKVSLRSQYLRTHLDMRIHNQIHRQHMFLHSGKEQKYRESPHSQYLKIRLDKNKRNQIHQLHRLRHFDRELMYKE